MFTFSREAGGGCWGAGADAEEEVVVFGVEGGGDARGGADGEGGGFVDMAADLDEVEEDGGVDGARARRRVVAVGQGLEDFGGELQPWAVEGGDVAPVSGWSAREWGLVGLVGGGGGYLLRQMIRAELEGAAAGVDEELEEAEEELLGGRSGWWSVDSADSAATAAAAAAAANFSFFDFERVMAKIMKEGGGGGVSCEE